MCVFCAAFTALYGVDADIALNPDRQREYDALSFGGKNQRKYRRKTKRRQAGGAR